MIGFAAVLALLAVLSVLSYRGFVKVSEGFGAFNQRVKVVGIVRDVDSRLRRHSAASCANSRFRGTKI